MLLVLLFNINMHDVMCSYSYLFTVERKDQKTLEKLRAERKAKIDELKERTNYYLTQQLIQVSGLSQAPKVPKYLVLNLSCLFLHQY